MAEDARTQESSNAFAEAGKSRSPRVPTAAKSPQRCSRGTLAFSRSLGSVQRLRPHWQRNTASCSLSLEMLGACSIGRRKLMKSTLLSNPFQAEPDTFHTLHTGYRHGGGGSYGVTSPTWGTTRLLSPSFMQELPAASGSCSEFVTVL